MPFPKAHAPRRHDRKCEYAVIDLNQVHAIATPAAQVAWLRTGVSRREVDTRRIDRKILNPEIATDIGQRKEGMGTSSDSHKEGSNFDSAA